MVYRPGLPPSGSESLFDHQDWTRRELERIGESLEETDGIVISVLHNEPDHPREGLLVQADGSDWNPGSGAGLYIYRSGSWTLIG